MQLKIADQVQEIIPSGKERGLCSLLEMICGGYIDYRHLCRPVELTSNFYDAFASSTIVNEPE